MYSNPAVWISLLAALLALAISFGVRISGTQSEAIINLGDVAIPLIIAAAGVWIRSKVYSPKSAEKALDMPQGTNLNLLNRVLATEVKVNPGDTKADVTEKVAAAEAKAEWSG